MCSPDWERALRLLGRSPGAGERRAPRGAWSSGPRASRDASRRLIRFVSSVFTRVSVALQPAPVDPVGRRVAGHLGVVKWPRGSSIGVDGPAGGYGHCTTARAPLRLRLNLGTTGAGRAEVVMRQWRVRPAASRRWCTAGRSCKTRVPFPKVPASVTSQLYVELAPPAVGNEPSHAAQKLFASRSRVI